MVKSKSKALILVCLVALLLMGPATSLASTTAVSPESIGPAGGNATLKPGRGERATKTKQPSKGALTATDITKADEFATDSRPSTERVSSETNDASVSMADWDVSQDGERFQNNGAEEPANALDPTRGKASPIGMNEFMALVYEHNHQIIVEELEWRISKEMINRAHSIFEPKLTGSYQHIYNHKPNTAEEILRRGFEKDFEEENHLTHTAIEGLLPTGGQLRFSYLFDNLNNNISGPRDEYQTTAGISVKHPLLKDFGLNATMVNIRVARADSNAAFQTYRQNMMLVIARAAASYWDLHSAQEKHRVRKKAVEIAQQILADNLQRVKSGKMAESEVLEVAAGLASRKSLASEAKQNLVAAIYAVRNFISSTGSGEKSYLIATDPLKLEEGPLDFGHSFWQAINLRPERLAAIIKLKREDIRLSFAENQRLPQLDLNASYAINGLDNHAARAWNSALVQDYESYSVSVELKIPLMGGKESRSTLRAAEHRKAQALHEFKAIEVELMNAVETAIQDVYNTRDQVRHYRKARHLHERLLELEWIRLDAGKSDSRIVLGKEESLSSAIFAELESLIRYKRAILTLAMSEGSLLERFGIEVLEKP